MKEGDKRDEGNANTRLLVGFVPGAAWVSCGFPRLGMFLGCLLVGFWILAWPIAIPLHFVFWWASVGLLRQYDTWELWDDRPTERIWRREMDGLLRRESL